jgi:hypothetical protein
MSVTSAFSNTAVVLAEPPPTPAAPSQLRLGTVSTTFVIMTWTDNANNEQGFYVERSTNGGQTWTRIGQTTANSTLFRNNGVARRTTYQYRVQAFNANGVSAFSNTLTVTIP